ncbi:transcription termination/antitermination protein NusA [Myxococcus sp. CA051A]|uniref:Transcription termination/antitermination protein NusA n=1 Tax=Myxococcus llanfairpwllgwyngyllgogerychwyrndrobwllllantysiliogogogochensis TaxID=2590453 RepID=A0A540WPG2_9BACT|nr:MULTISPECIES: transcription termination factor NusA [Myxococcus]NTX08138.1 transcription termination/antitermination protein NusA [Myxococcus sp. CA040A]NTX17763.1 transcription termination/antitermination protein NusA [Myxococcus sp. CA056]NTX39900.1 transcription termination/antitermination protein NusA [Myxococcus sp. CA033]NTX55687.1 transcription termination/antitermination protein NusA [Myxococcus sp. CA039A]NTX65984.1 transcription termination/antitermination protein NusA [Myxococcus
MPTQQANPTVNLNLVLDQVAKDKGIDRAVLIATLEDAMKTAAKKHFGQDRNLEAKYDADKGVVELFQAITVVEEITDPVQAVNQINLTESHKKGMEVEPGDELVFQIFYRDEDANEAKAQDDQYGDILRLKTFRRGFGRIAAQTAKQVILQRTRDAERENVFNEYKDRKNEIVTGIARRFERGNIIVDLGRAEAVLPVREQVPRETYRPGDRVQAYVLDVLRESKGPQIVLSRASVNLLTKLFEMEVPEIAEGIVVIEAAAREPGGRAKIAVSSRDSDVDPVGACVGMKGSRVQAVVQELRGEKIDIVPYDEDPARFVCSALAPAEVSRVIIDEANHAMELIVPDDQLSLAIGRRGQNVRLAAQLTGWKLDINSESRVREMREFASRSLGALPGVNEMLVETLYAHGFRQARDVAEANAEMLAQIPGVDPARVPSMQEEARRRMVEDQAELSRMDYEREQARLAEARRHPDELSQTERMARVRGVGEKTIEQLVASGYRTVEDIANEKDLAKLGDVPGVGIKKARQLKSAAENYLVEEAKLRTELNAERGITTATLDGGAEATKSP